MPTRPTRPTQLVRRSLTTQPANKGLHMPATPRVGLLARRALGVSVIAALMAAVMPITPAYAGGIFVVATNDQPGADAAPNTATAKIVLQPSSTFTQNADVTFTRTGTSDDTPSVTVTSAQPAEPFGNGQLTVQADLLSANPGTYDIDINEGPFSDSCSACFTVLSAAPTVTSVSPSAVAQSGGSTFVVTGTRFARGNYDDNSGDNANYNCATCDARPTVTIERNGVPVAGVTLAETRNTNGTDNPTPSTATTITKLIFVAPGTVTGPANVVVTNSDGQKGICTACFTIPAEMTGAPSPNFLGQGSTNRTITINGTNFPTDVQGGIADSPDVFGDTDPGMTYTFVRDSATQARFINVNVEENAAVGSRTIQLYSPSLSDALNMVFNVTGKPVATSRALIDGAGSSYGQGATNVRFTVSGSNFVPGKNTAGTHVVLSPPTGITFASSEATSTSSISVVMSVAPDAPVQARTISVVNPDGGAAACANAVTGAACTVSITAKPVITAISPATAGRDTTKTFTFTGTNFRQASGSTKAPTFALSNVTLGTSSGDEDNPTTRGYYNNGKVSKTVVGPQSATVTNNDTLGTSSCASCFAITSLEVTGPTGQNGFNSGTKTGVTVQGLGFDKTATVELVKTFFGSATVPPIQGTVTTAPSTTSATSADGTSLIASFPLSGVDPGTYAFRVTNPAGTAFPGMGQGGTFTVVADSPTLTSAAPNSRGRGAAGETIQLTGSGFGPNATVSFSNLGVHVDSITRLSSTRIDAVIRIDQGAAIDTGTVRVTNTDNTSATAPFSVVAGPQFASPAISPAAKQMGSAPSTVTLKGQPLTFPSTANAQLLFSASHVTATNVVVTPGRAASTGVTAVNDTMTATITVASGTAGPLDVIVKDKTTGGRAVCAACFNAQAAPPSAPTGVTATPGNGEATVSWTPGTDNGATITSYRVTSSPGGFTKTVTGNPASSPATVTGLTNGVAYRFTVVARNSVGDGPASTLSPPVTPRTTPGTVTGVSAQPGDGSVTLSWTAPGNGGATIKEYVVTTNPGATTTSVTSVPAGSAPPTTATIAGLNNGTAYTFTVKARNDVGFGSASAPVTATPSVATPPSAPTGLKALAGDGRAALSWTAPTNNGGAAITGYTVKTALANGTPVKESPASGTSLTVINLANGTAYQFTVVANNSKGASPASAPATATPKFATKLTSTRSVATPVAGQGITFSGVLSRASSGAKIAGATVVLTVDPEIGATRTAQLTTDANGIWTTRQGHLYNSVVSVRFAGDADDAPVSAASSKMPVSPRITRTAPANGSSSAATSTLLVKGSISPNKAGRTVVLHKNGSAYTTATVAADGTFSISSRLPKGTYTLKVVIGASPGNVFGQSASFTITRT
jgi:hypothetical protein